MASFGPGRQLFKNYKELRFVESYVSGCGLQNTTNQANYPQLTRWPNPQLEQLSASRATLRRDTGRKTTADYLRFLYMSYCSYCQIKTPILLSGDLKYLKAESLSELQQDIGEVERMLKALIRSLEKKS